MSDLDRMIWTVALVSMLAALPLGSLIARLLARRDDRVSELIKLVKESGSNGGKSHIVTLNDFRNIDRHKESAPLMRSYRKFISKHGSTGINAVHWTISESGVRDPSKSITAAQIITADRIIKELIDQELPYAEWEYHPLTAHAVMHVADTELLISIIQRGVTDHEQALQLLSVMKAVPSAALLDGAL